MQVLGPLLTLIKEVDHELAVPGDTLNYTIHYSNIGDDYASLVLIHESIPENTHYLPGSSAGEYMTVTYSADGGFTYSGNENENITHLQFMRTVPLLDGESQTVEFKVIIQ